MSGYSEASQLANRLNTALTTYKLSKYSNEAPLQVHRTLEENEREEE